jgi:hypothetical protein
VLYIDYVLCPFVVLLVWLMSERHSERRDPPGGGDGSCLVFALFRERSNPRRTPEVSSLLWVHESMGSHSTDAIRMVKRKVGLGSRGPHGIWDIPHSVIVYHELDGIMLNYV